MPTVTSCGWGCATVPLAAAVGRAFREPLPEGGEPLFDDLAGGAFCDLAFFRIFAVRRSVASNSSRRPAFDGDFEATCSGRGGC